MIHHFNNPMNASETKDCETSWYHPDGTACHTVTGSSTGQPRPATLRDARKLGLLPSVSNILSILDRPAVGIWRQQNAISAALNTPRQPYEAEADWHARIAEESVRLSRQSTGWAEVLRDQISGYHRTESPAAGGELRDYLKSYETWYLSHVLETISPGGVVQGDGYGDRLELHAMVRHEGKDRRAMIHVKPRKLKGRKSAVFYPEWGMQLAACAAALAEPGERLPLLISLVLPADVPGPVQAKVWGNPAAALASFRACQTLWAWEKQYDPRAGE